LCTRECGVLESTAAEYAQIILGPVPDPQLVCSQPSILRAMWIFRKFPTMKRDTA